MNGASKESNLEYISHPQHALAFNEVKKLALLYLDKYLKEGLQGIVTDKFLEENLEQFLWVYRIILMPETLLKELLFQFGEKHAKANYRRLCILTHPDKNCHPLAAKAFQRLIACADQPARV